MIAALVLPLLAAASVQPVSEAVGPTAAELAGAWAGSIEHEGEKTSFALELEAGADGKLLLKATIPSAHLEHAPIARVEMKLDGRELQLGPFAFDYDAQAKTLSGVVSAGFVPVYRIPLVLKRVERIEIPPRPEPGGALAEPVWTFETGSPLWPGPAYAGGLVYVGAEDGQLHALEASSGRKRWSFRAGGALRARPVIADGALLFQADDGFLYSLDAASGREKWRTQLVEKPIERLPFDDPKSRYDRFGSDVVVAGGRLYVGPRRPSARVQAVTASGRWR